MTDAERIATIKSQTLAILAEITASPKPTYSIGGQMVSWNRYFQLLQGTVTWCDLHLAGESPFEIRSQGLT